MIAEVLLEGRDSTLRALAATKRLRVRAVFEVCLRLALAVRVRLLGRSPRFERNDAAGVFLGPHPGGGRWAAQADELLHLAQVVE